MPQQGGNKEHVKIVPFGTKPPAPSDFSHLTDISNRRFAMDLSSSTPDPRKPPKSKKKDYDDDDDISVSSVAESVQEVDTPPPRPHGKINPDDLQRFLDAEGGGVYYYYYSTTLLL